MHPGMIIRLVRTAEGLSQTDLACKLKVTRTYLSLVETGKKNPSLQLIKQTAEVLAIPVPVLFVEQGGPEKAVMDELHKVLAGVLTAKAAIVANRDKHVAAAKT